MKGEAVLKEHLRWEKTELRFTPLIIAACSVRGAETGTITNKMYASAVRGAETDEESHSRAD